MTDAPDPADPDAPGWSRPRPSGGELRADAALAGVLLVAAVLTMVLYRSAGFYPEPASGAVSVAALVGVTLPLAVRRRWPSAVAAVVAAAFLVGGLLHVPEQVISNIALFMALYTVGAWEPSRARASWTRGLVVLGMFVWLVVALYSASADAADEDAPPGASGPFSPFVALSLVQLVTNALFFAGAWWFGDHAWRSARERARTALRTRLLQAERVRAEAQAVTIERLRLARELHDAVAHHVSLMGVGAAAARTLLPVDPPRAAEALEGVEGAAREALTELHGLVRTLRQDEGAPDATPHAAGGGPSDGSSDGASDGSSSADGSFGRREALGSLGVDRLPALVAETTAGGVEATLAVVGQPRPLPPTVSLNLYRIAQEALTNVRKHAGPGAHADVRLRWLDDAVELEVSDDGRGPRRGREAAWSSPGWGAGGLGLVGMRERVAADGGELHVGPRRGGGFLVRASVPRRRVEVGASVGGGA
ncbi:sensor histidine kinase [Cellulomonas marina]|uniref:sensor histidine kinase n=1 Tax=Cellulomonas marina TaxID=988821 RepID=UPI001EF34105|nr:sensor histidine kinase [Cellulomonas marina]